MSTEDLAVDDAAPTEDVIVYNCELFQQRYCMFCDYIVMFCDVIVVFCNDIVMFCNVIVMFADVIVTFMESFCRLFTQFTFFTTFLKRY